MSSTISSTTFGEPDLEPTEGWYDMGLSCINLKPFAHVAASFRKLHSNVSAQQMCTPSVVVETKNASGEWQEFARTEIVHEMLSPRFSHWMAIYYDPTKHQPLRFQVLNHDSFFARLNKSKKGFSLGEYYTDVKHLVEARNMRTRATMYKSRNAKKLGSNGTEDVNTEGTFRDVGKLDILLVKGSGSLASKWARFNLQVMGFSFSLKIDSFLEVFRDGDGTFDLVYRTGVVNDCANPHWDPFAIPISRLCKQENLNANVRIVCFEWKPTGSHVEQAHITLPLREMMELSRTDRDNTVSMAYVVKPRKGEAPPPPPPKAAPVAQKKFDLYSNAPIKPAETKEAAPPPRSLHKDRPNIPGEKAGYEGRIFLRVHQARIYVNNANHDISPKKAPPPSKLRRHLGTSSIQADKAYLEDLSNSEISRINPEFGTMVRECLWSMTESQQRFSDRTGDGTKLLATSLPNQSLPFHPGSAQPSPARSEPPEQSLPWGSGAPGKSPAKKTQSSVDMMLAVNKAANREPGKAGPRPESAPPGPALAFGEVRVVKRCAQYLGGAKIVQPDPPLTPLKFLQSIMSPNHIFQKRNAKRPSSAQTARSSQQWAYSIVNRKPTTHKLEPDETLVV